MVCKDRVFGYRPDTSGSCGASQEHSEHCIFANNDHEILRVDFHYWCRRVLSLVMNESFLTEDKFSDFILRITHQIWEERNVPAIGTYYGNDVVVRSPSGVTVGNQAVIDSTYATLREFPDRQLLGEDVIHNGSDDEEWLSSHRIFSTATHLGKGYFGEPSGRPLRYRVIADCAVRNGVIFDEWLVRDFGAIVRQMGSTPEDFARTLVNSAGGSTREEDRKFSIVPAIYRSRGNDHLAGRTLAKAVIEMLNGDFDSVSSRFDRAAQFDLPGGNVVNGRDAGLRALQDLLVPLVCKDIVIEHELGHSDLARRERGAVRTITQGLHAKSGWLGAPTSKELAVLSIWHAEYLGAKISRLFVLQDEVAMWRQVLST